jgi:hypothetical protein
MGANSYSNDSTSISTHPHTNGFAVLSCDMLLLHFFAHPQAAKCNPMPALEQCRQQLTWTLSSSQHAAAQAATGTPPASAAGPAHASSTA